MASYKKVKQEAGRACMTAAIGVVVAVFVTANVNGCELSDNQLIVCMVVGILLMVVSILLLVEKSGKNLSGKWKRIKVKKDTTIHIQEEDE